MAAPAGIGSAAIKEKKIGVKTAFAAFVVRDRRSRYRLPGQLSGGQLITPVDLATPSEAGR